MTTTWCTRLVGVIAVLAVAVGCSSEDAAFRRVSRSDPALAWTGDRVFVYGGAPGGEWEARPLGDAALWDPRSEEYESMADPPFDLPLKPGAASVAVGDAVVLLGTLCETPLVLPDNASYSCSPGSVAAATYDTSEDTWIVHDIPPELARFTDAHVDGVGATSDGRAVFSVTARGQRLWAVDVEGAWEALPPLPPALRRFHQPLCLAGDTVAGLAKVPDRRTLRLHLLALVSADPSWATTGPVAPSRVGTEMGSAQLACGDGFAVVHGYAFGSAQRHSTDPTGSDGWIPLPPAPVEISQPVVVWTGATLDFLVSPYSMPASGPGLAYDPAADAWHEVRATPLPTTVVTVAGTPARPAVVWWPPDGGTEPLVTEIRG